MSTEVKRGEGKMVARSVAAGHRLASEGRPRLSVDVKSSSRRAGLLVPTSGSPRSSSRTIFVSVRVNRENEAICCRSPILQYTSGQPDNRGFISIDCGIPENSSYQDLRSSIIYVSDHGFVSSGANHNISPEYIKPSLAQSNYNVRFFPYGARNCYTLRSLVAGNKYFVCADFYYGNYDGLNKLPVFDLYLGASYWHEVMFNDASSVNWTDIKVVAPAEYLQVCLVNKGMGTPFISGLDLRPLKSDLYPEANASQYFVLINSNRFNIGPTDSSIVRYPLDPHDRIWSTYYTIPNWTEISATSLVENYLTDAYDVPSAVMQTAATPINGSRVDLSWDPSDPSVNISS